MQVPSCQPVAAVLPLVPRGKGGGGGKAQGCPLDCALCLAQPPVGPCRPICPSPSPHMPTAPCPSLQYIDLHQGISKSLGKPLLMEEFNIKMP